MDLVLEELRAMRLELAELAGRLGRVEAPPAQPGPITSWGAVARLLAVSVDTLARRRAAHRDKHTAWFADEAEVRAWYASLQLPPAKPARAPRTAKPAKPSKAGSAGGRIDFLAEVARLTTEDK